MGRKIFISYKYADSQVKNILENKSFLGTCTVRNYVDQIETNLKDKTDHIYKGESDGEDLSQLTQSTIWEKLKNRIYDSTLTIVMISKGMKDTYKKEINQWIPQEISYSLKEVSRKDKSGNPITSRTNALLGVIIPDVYGSYDYFTYEKNCCDSGCKVYLNNSTFLFKILKGNLFNQKEPDSVSCKTGGTVYHGEPSYLYCVKWSDFENNMEAYIDKAYSIQEKQEDYEIQKEI